MIDKAIQDSHGKRKPTDSLEMEKQEKDSYFGNLLVKYHYLFYVIGAFWKSDDFGCHWCIL